MPTIRTRSDDERVLKALHLRCAGHTTEEVGRKLGMKRNSVISATRNVRWADLAESGENEAEVESGYSWITDGGRR